MSEDQETAISDGPEGPRVERTEDLAGKYMTFKLAQEAYGLEILRVREIIELMEITRIPRAESHVRGVINLRGKIIPVVDLRLKFEMEPAEATDQTVIIVVQFIQDGEETVMGILVDEVVEVLDVPGSQIESPPRFGGDVGKVDFILGVGKSEERVLFLLDIGKVLGGEPKAPVDDLVAA